MTSRLWLATLVERKLALWSESRLNLEALVNEACRVFYVFLGWWFSRGPNVRFSKSIHEITMTMHQPTSATKYSTSCSHIVFDRIYSRGDWSGTFWSLTSLCQSILCIFPEVYATMVSWEHQTMSPLDMHKWYETCQHDNAAWKPWAKIKIIPKLCFRNPGIFVSCASCERRGLRWVWLTEAEQRTYSGGS